MVQIISASITIACFNYLAIYEKSTNVRMLSLPPHVHTLQNSYSACPDREVSIYCLFNDVIGYHRLTVFAYIHTRMHLLCISRHLVHNPYRLFIPTYLATYLPTLP